MEYFIRQNATSPILVMKIIKDGRNDFHKLHEMLDNSCITFAMINPDCGVYKIAHKNAGYIKTETIHPDSLDEFVIFYRWAASDTDTPGRYRGEFRIKFYETNEELIVPIREELYINILPSITKMRNC
jgi:hypothetical protein